MHFQEVRAQNISILIQKNGSLKRKDGIKATSKLSRANTKYLASCAAPGTYGPKGLKKPQYYSPAFPNPHSLSLGRVHLIVSGFPQQMFWHLQNPNVSLTAQITPPSKFHKLPSWGMTTGILTLPHITQPPRFPSEMWVEIPVIL